MIFHGCEFLQISYQYVGFKNMYIPNSFISFQILEIELKKISVSQLGYFSLLFYQYNLLLLVNYHSIF